MPLLMPKMAQFMKQQPFYVLLRLPVEFKDLFHTQQNRGPAVQLCGPARAAAQAQIQHNGDLRLRAEQGRSVSLPGRNSGGKGPCKRRQILRQGPLDHRDDLFLKIITGNVIQALLSERGGDAVGILPPARQVKGAIWKGGFDLREGVFNNHGYLLKK